MKTTEQKHISYKLNMNRKGFSIFHVLMLFPEFFQGFSMEDSRLGFLRKNFQLASTPKNKQLKLRFYPFLIWKQLKRNTFLISLTWIKRGLSIFHVLNAFPGFFQGFSMEDSRVCFLRKYFQLASTPKNKQLKLPLYPFLIWKQLKRNTFNMYKIVLCSSCSSYHVGH